MFIPLILPLYYFLFKNSKNEVLFYFGVILLFFLSASRSTNVGVDTITNMSRFASAKMNNLQYIWEDYLTSEPIYCTIEYLCAKWGMSFRSFMGVQTLLFLTPITIGLRKMDEKPIASLLYLILLGFFFCSMNVTRQMIALSFCFCGYTLLERKKIVYGTLLLLISVGFHTTALLTVVVLMLLSFKPPKSLSIVVLVVSFVGPLFLNLSSYMILLVESISAFDSFLLYIDDDFSDLGRLPIYNTLRTGMFVFALYNYKIEDNKSDLFFNIALLAVVVHNLLYGVPSFVGRVAYYFDIVFITFFVRWSSNNLIASLLTMFYSVLYYFHQYIILKHDGVIPFVLDL